MKSAKETTLSSALTLLLCFGITACGIKKSPAVEPVSNEVALSTDASETSPYEYHPSKLIGINPLIPVRADGANMEAPLRKYLNAFGIVALGNAGSCSGTHIGNGYVLTAGHCFMEGAATPSMANQPCPTTKVYWGYRGSPATGNPKPTVTGMSQCTKVIYAELSITRDFAIFQVDNPPKEFVTIAAETAPTSVNTKLTIFGYPRGRPLEWSQYCPLKKSTVAGPDIKSSERFAYQCDTEPGNSGSSVIAINSNGSAKVVGVHDAAAPDPYQYNVGTYMFHIRTTLLKMGFNLDKAVGATATRFY